MAMSGVRVRVGLLSVVVLSAVWACSEDDTVPSGPAEAGQGGEGGAGGSAGSTAGDAGRGPIVGGGGAGASACEGECEAGGGGAAGHGGVTSSCERPLGDEAALLDAIECEQLCVPGKPRESYRVENDCGGFNLVRGAGEHPKSWSFDSNEALVGVRVAGSSDTAECASGVVYGEPCAPVGASSLVCVPGSSGGDGGAGGTGGQASEARSWLENAEQCGQTCSDRPLDELCSEHDVDCPAPMDGFYPGVVDTCRAGDVTYVASDCGGSIITSEDAAGNRTAWHFNGDDELIGAAITRKPDVLGAYCAEGTYGTRCAPTGPQVSLCPEHGGGCTAPFVSNPDFHPEDVTLACYPFQSTYRFANDCGGVNIRKVELEHGYEQVLSFDENGVYIGEYYRDEEEEPFLHECTSGSLGFGTLTGRICRSVGKGTNLCN